MSLPEMGTRRDRAELGKCNYPREIGAHQVSGLQGSLCFNQEQWELLAPGKRPSCGHPQEQGSLLPPAHRSLMPLLSICVEGLVVAPQVCAEQGRHRLPLLPVKPPGQQGERAWP